MGSRCEHNIERRIERGIWKRRCEISPR